MKKILTTTAVLLVTFVANFALAANAKADTSNCCGSTGCAQCCTAGATGCRDCCGDGCCDAGHTCCNVTEKRSNARPMPSHPKGTHGQF
jgi:hypothetical protein